MKIVTKTNKMTLEIENYGKYFQDLFIREFECRPLNNEGNNDPNQKCNKRKNDHNNPEPDDINLLQGSLPELIPNASQFAIYNAVRQLVLEIKNKKHVIKYINKTKKIDSDNAESKTCSLSDRNLDEQEAADNVERDIGSHKLPLIVGAGIRSLFDIITETKTEHPVLCQKALTAIFNIIQGQNPESFKSEPNDIFLALFDLLLELATATEAPASVTEQSEYIPLSDIACSTLLALCVAKGDTGKLLKAVTSTIITRKLSLHQRIHLPQILIKLQRSVQAVILGKLTKPNFFTGGIPQDALVDEFDIEEFNLDSQVITSQPCIASDGKFLYILAGKVLLKVGTGFNGTTKGHVYFLNREFSKDKCGWIGFCNRTLYYKRSSKRNNENILIVDTNSLTVNKSVVLSDTHRKENCLLFSDGESVNTISSTSDDTLRVKQIYSLGCFTFDLNLKLTKKGFRTLGYANFEEELLTETQVQEIQASYNQFVPTAPYDVDIAGILCGKEFGVAQSTDGKTFYYGKACSLGLKSVGRNPYLKLNELIISKISKTVQIALGHEGLHGLFLNEDGNVYFAGCARRGEDGETSKNRRQIKSVKPKKIAKLDGQTVIDISCNNGTSCFVTKTGKLIMFGKDTSYCDSFGFISDLDDQHITKTSLGKAHCVALNIRGEVFTFGLNNKSQCGRVFAAKNNDQNDDEGSFDQKRNKKYHEVINEGDIEVQYASEFQKKLEGAVVKATEAKALPGPHYQSSSCVHASPNCYTCTIKEKAIRSDKDASQGSDPDRDTPRIVSLPPAKLILPSSNPVVQVSCGLHHTVLLTLTGEVFTFGSNAYGQLGTGDLQPVQTPIQVRIKGKAIQVAAGSNHTVILTASGNVFTFGKYHKGQLGRLPNEMTFNRHDVVQTGQLFSQNIVLTGQKFFWNCHPVEVFGIGADHGKKASWIGASGDQTFIKMDESLVNAAMLSKFNVAADKNTILLIPNTPTAIKCIAINRKDGSCRAHSNDQFYFTNTEIERQHEGVFEPGTSSRYSDSSSSEHSKTGTSPGRTYTEIGRYLDQSRFIPTMAFTIDNYYDVLYAFNFATKKVMCFNVILAGIPMASDNTAQFKSLFVPDIALTTKHDLSVTRYNSALNILACLDILSSAQGSIPSCFESESKDTKDASQSENDEYNTICRFENFGGGWGYSGNSVEAIRFMCDTDILIAGFGMFGGRGEYTCKIKLYDLGIDGGGGFEKDGIIIAETDEVSYECAARNKQNIMLPKPTPIFAGKWYLVTARISGPSSDCGSSGQTTITTEDQVMFTFKPSKKSNNGTDVHSGQIPSILYRVVTQENKQQPSKNSDPVCKISKNFSNTLSAECFESLICLLKWSWNSLKITINETAETKKFRINRISSNILVYLCKVCLRLLRKYTNEIYPNHGFNNDETSQIKPGKFGNDAGPTTSNKDKPWPGPKGAHNKNNTAKITNALSDMSLMETTTPVSGKKNNSENIMIAECIGDVRALLIHILCDDLQFVNTNLSGEIMQIMEECDVTFIQCFNAFYPTQLLKWNCLCNLLHEMDKGQLHPRLLSVVIAGLCDPSVNLKKTFSILSPPLEQKAKSMVSPSDNFGFPMLMSAENYQYPVLVEQMLFKTQKEKSDFMAKTWNFNEVFLRLFDIISRPIRNKIDELSINPESDGNFTETTTNKNIVYGQLINNCCHLISKVLSEIVYQTCSSDSEAYTTTANILHSTGSRFAKFDSNKTWNTGNFGSDAIAFTVDRPGISIAGVSVYSGSGTYEYQLELLYDCSEFQTQSQHKWEVLSSVSGTYDQDIVKNDMAELKFDRPMSVKEYVRYAIRLCSQGARTSSGDCGYISLRGPCGVTFKFYPCDMSFNGTTISRGQIPALLYYSTPYLNDRTLNKCNRESYAKSVALQIATDIIKRCTELLINVRNALALCTLLSDKGSNSSNNLKTLDSEHNITPIEEHFDISWTNNGDEFNTHIAGSSSLSAKHITRRIENFSKGIMETFKLDRRITNPFEFEIDVGAKEISPNDVIVDDINNEKVKKAQASQINGNLKQSPKNKYDEKKGNAVIDAEINANQIVQNRVINLFSVEDTSLFHILLPQVFAYIGRLVVSDPKTSVDILNLIREILPHVSALNQIYYFNLDIEPGPSYMASRISEIQPELCTTSRFYCVVESDHPYKSATVSNYSVEFPSCVKWMTLEFDPQSGTGQVEDSLLVSIPSEKCTEKTLAATIANNKKGERLSKEKSKPASVVNNDNNIGGKKPLSDGYITVKRLNSGHQWPSQAIILPGNRIEFSLQTASNYLKDNKANRYGFKCLVIGYEDINQSKISKFCLAHLEHELAYLGGMCSATLMKNDNIYTDDVYDDYTDAEQVLQKHTELLSNGLFATGGLETINNIFDSHLLVGEQSYEKQFLKDFIDVVPESAGARLAAWLQPESRLDPNKCLLRISQEPLRNGWPTQLIIETRDQYGEPVYVPDIKIEIRTVFGNDVNPHDARKVPQLSYGDLYSSDIFLPTKKKYRTTVKDKEKSYLKAITAMKCYSDFSFEELRLFSFLEKKNSEVIRATDCGDLRYSGSWTPSATGNYCLSLIIDDIVAEEVYKVEVIDCGAPPPLQKTTLKKVQPQNRLRKFMAKNSAGLRIRLHPTLQSEQVGVLKVNGIISFTDELENDDGLWLRLTTESIREHCSPNWFPSEAWCLQYNQHLDKTLLFPIIETDPLNIFESSNADSQGFSEALSEPDLQLGPVISAKSQSTYNDAKDSVVTEEKLHPVEFKDQSCDAKHWQTHQKKGSQSNISATIAGVVGEGAIKLQALQKWFKGDRGEGHEGMRQEYRRSESDAGIETGIQLIRNERSHSLFDEFKDDNDGSPFREPTSKTKLDKQAEDFARAFLKVTSDLKEQSIDDPLPSKDGSATKILKRALSPSIAETLRTVFAAFLWHEGLIHDAMACASFLKFHPNISKDFSVLENIAETEVLTREQKAQQRHSLEIASAEAYLNMKPATLESLTKSGNCCVHNRKRRSVRTTIDETGTGVGLREKLTREILPPALKGLVYMWDQLCCNFIQLAETSTTDGKEKVKMKGSSEEKRNENRTYQRNKKDDGSWCELCDIFLPIPVTYHMRIVHPGCGKSSNGKGYNSIGSYCEGWAGNCGEGGQGASSWYLMCDNCREKYSSNGKKNLDFNHMSSNSLQLSYNSTLIRSELFQIMKENSLFLLELNTGNKNFPNRSKSRVSGMFTIKERSYHQHDIGEDYLDYISDASFDNVSVKAAKMAVTGTFDSIWCPPDSLSCLETLGGKFGSDLPYNFFELNGMGDVEFDRTIFNETNNGDQFEQNLIQHQMPSTSKFHRSFSVEQGWLSQTTTLQNLCRKAGEDDMAPSGVVMRRKKNCTCGKNACDSVLLRHPSVHLKRLVPENVLSSNGSASVKLIENSNKHHIDDSVNEDDLLAANSLLLRPSMLFILEVHDLKKLKCLMKKKVQKTIGSIYSLQALNWIIRSVTQTVSLHDLMWWFVTALKSSSILHDGNPPSHGEEEQALEHPVSSNQIGGNICEVQSQSLHNLLSTIAELTLMMPSGSALQKISIQCFGLKFKASDHQFLHRCHVFANISKILSKSEEQNEENSMASVNFVASSSGVQLQQANDSSVSLTNLQDVTDIFEITVSSRPAMVNSLIDNSTETFWESDEEDRNKPKLIEASQIKSNYVCKVVSVFIDNSRDISTRVSSIFVYGGQSLREMNFITTIDVDAIECAWIPVRIEDDSLTHFRIEFRGSENTLRVRQIKLLGYDIKNHRNQNDPKATNSSYIQQQNCEVETLRVFRMLTNQVFGKLIVKSPGNGNLLATPRSRELSTVISPSAESLDLREHMVGILFSRSKLTHLQRQIIVHIVHAIQKETQRIREEWEAKVILTSATSESPEREKTDASEGDNYIFELLSMVLALSGSGVGKSYLSHQHGLLRDLLTLLHTGSDRIQRQVTALFRRILSEITPEGFGLILGITKVPQTDYGIINENSEDFDMHKLGIIDIFLAVIGKSLQIQLKTQTKMHSKTKVITTVKLCHYHLLDGTEYRSKHSDTNTKSKETFTSDTEFLNPRMVATMYSDLYQSSSSCQESYPDQYDQVDDKSRDDLAQIELKRIEEVNNFTNRWFMKGTIANKQAENMINFFKDMINGKFGERWSLVSKAAIAECIINLTRLDEQCRLPENCVKTPTIWLALASLCVLDKDHVKRLSSSQWSKTLETRPMCTNHDDGMTPAIIECGTCGSLCGDCDRFLHLNRRTRSHYRTLCKEEEEAISVELHEHCGRTKLFWLLALADSKTLKGMVEFRDGHSNILGATTDTVGRCRFCGTTGNTGLLAVGNVCAEQQCQEYAAEACNKILSCGHFCNGIADEEKCLCLHSKCQRSSSSSGKPNEPKLTQDGDDMCMICFTEALSAQPSIQLNCGHVFHSRCCKQVLVKRWYGARITFGFAQCGICKSDIAHDALNDILEPIMALKNDVKRKALMRLHYEGIKDTSSKDMAQFAMDKYAYYMCSQCDKAYYGGEVRCDQELGEKYDPKELVCGGCSDVSRAQICPKHGTDYLEYKCRYCCSVAIFFCFGTTHFCDVCHDDFQKLTNIPKNKLPQCPVGPKAKKLQGDECPLHIVHPPTGEEFALGCGICRNAQNF